MLVSREFPRLRRRYQPAVGSVRHALDTAARQAATVQEVEHRPWPLPDGPWVMGQTWDDLLFAHWRVPVDALLGHVPDGLTLDVFDGSAWLGVTPFKLEGLRVRGLPPAPHVSSFL